MCVRLIRITGVDLNFYDFDRDLTWAGFFLNSEGQILGRFGGRDGKDADNRNSLDGLRFSMEAALARHKQSAPPEQANRPPLLIENVKLKNTPQPRGCIHCHQAKEILRQHEIENGSWDPESRWVYPLPENLGITLDLVRGNLVREVRKNSLADKAGMQAGDILEQINRRPVFSFADAQYALHLAPAQGKLTLSWSHGVTANDAEIVLASGWKKTNLTWRPSLLDLLASPTIYGDDLSATEKKSLGLDSARLAFRQDTTVHAHAKAAGVRPGDIILGINGQEMTMTMDQFLAHIRQNYLIGDRVVLNVIREGTKANVAMTLK